MKRIIRIDILKKDNETAEDKEYNTIQLKYPITEKKALELAKVYIGDFNFKKYHYVVDINSLKEGIYVLDNPNSEFEYIE